MIIGKREPQRENRRKAAVVDEVQGKRHGKKQDAETDDEGPDTGIPVGVGMSFRVMGVVRHCFSLVFMLARGKIITTTVASCAMLKHN
jgi:hypothetical protein